MVNLKKFAYALAHIFVNGTDTNKPPLDVIAYGLEIVLNIIVQLSVLVILGFLFSILKMVLSAVIPTVIFRLFSGGSHLSSFTSCTIISTLVFCSIGYIAHLVKLDSNLIVLVFIIMMLITYWYAPNNPNRNFNIKKIRAFKLLSLCYLALVIGILLSFQINRNMINAVLLGLLWQSFNITSIGVRIISLFDMLINKGKGGIIVEKG